MTSEYGRIAEDGTVYLRTPAGERPIGSWQAGTVEEGIAFYSRRYADLAADVALLEGRARSSAADPQAVAVAARKLLDSLPEAAVIGDVAALEVRLAGVLSTLDERLAARAEQRVQAAAAAADAKRALVSEAESLSMSTQWRAAGERYRSIVEEWKGIRGVDRRTDAALWDQLAAARRQFDARRRSHFAELDQQRGAAAERKEHLAREAEKLADSTDWAPTARRFRELMTEWKASGRAAREVEESLWQRFKAAQDSFFTRRSEVFAERDASLRANLEAKQALLEEAESLDATADPEGVRRRMRSIHERWDKVGHVPRDDMPGLEERLGAAERRVREATASSRQVTVTESPLVVRLRESIGKLEARLARAKAAGDTSLVTETETSLTTQREWLAQAEKSGR